MRSGTAVCSNGAVSAGSFRVRPVNETRDRILDAALDVLGENPGAGTGVRG
jgi:AcrR family transcriptional regulator